LPSLSPARPYGPGTHPPSRRVDRPAGTANAAPAGSAPARSGRRPNGCRGCFSANPAAVPLRGQKQQGVTMGTVSHCVPPGRLFSRQHLAYPPQVRGVQTNSFPKVADGDGKTPCRISRRTCRAGKPVSRSLPLWSVMPRSVLSRRYAFKRRRADIAESAAPPRAPQKRGKRQAQNFGMSGRVRKCQTRRLVLG